MTSRKYDRCVLCTLNKLLTLDFTVELTVIWAITMPTTSGRWTSVRWTPPRQTPAWPIPHQHDNERQAPHYERPTHPTYTIPTYTSRTSSWQMWSSSTKKWGDWAHEASCQLVRWAKPLWVKFALHTDFVTAVSLCLDESDSNKANFDVYLEHFKSPFIQSTSKCYALESKTFLAENSVSLCMKNT